MKKNIYKLNIKSLEESGIVTGYASVFNNIDHHDDIIKPGSFLRSITKHQKEQHIKLLWQHMCDQPIGVIISLTEDGYGLLIKAKLLLDVSKAKEVYSLLKSKAVNGLSIGFSLKEHYFKGDTRIITDAELLEVSLVTFPANNLAKITEIKNKENKMNYKDTNEIDLNKDEYRSRLERLEAVVARPGLYHQNTQTEHDEHKQAFESYLRSGGENNLHLFEKKSYSGGSKQDGGLLITPSLSKKITQALNEKSVIRQVAGVETISTDSLDILEDLAQPQAGWVREEQRREDTQTTQFSRRRILVHELYAQPKATQRLIDDAYIDLERWLGEKLINSFSKLENQSFINGDGIDKPKGILSYESGKEWGKIERVKSGNSNNLKPESLINLQCSLNERYIANAAFIVSPSAYQEMKLMKNQSGNYYLNPILYEKGVDTIFGIPVYVCSDMPDFAPGNTPIMIADLSVGYKIVDRQDIRIMRDPFTEKPFVKFYTTKRVGGDVVDFNAIKLLEISK